MEIIKNVKGTHDIYGEENNAYEFVENLMKSIAEIYSYKGVRPPVLESNSVFVRGVGSSSDIVRKEMYTFKDHGDRDITLRPEFTAGIMRMIVQNKLYATNELPLKYYYLGPVFRYERPQLGRYRQFNQFGVECVGHNSYMLDVDVIALAYTILTSLGLEDVTIKINTLGDDESRSNYREALKSYFAKHIENMCEDCKVRFELNPLRILDCKVPEDREVIESAPIINDYLSESSRDRFTKVLQSLKALQIPYEIDSSLVRGLDYYSETVFEFHYKSKKGVDYGAIGAGGHYGKLMSELGGPDYPGVGFSFGIERVVSVLKDDDLLADAKDELDAYVMPMSEDCNLYAEQIAVFLRNSGGYRVDVCADNCKMGAMFKRASTKGAKFAVIIGENELNEESVVIKDLESQEQQTVKVEKLIEKFDELFSSSKEEEK